MHVVYADQKVKCQNLRDTKKSTEGHDLIGQYN